MYLSNSTPIPAATALGQIDETAPTVCQVTAKATFNFDAAGRVSLETQHPYPLFDKDEETALGLLPSDALPHPAGTFSVIAAAAAHSPDETEEIAVALTVGEVSKRLRVIGDRHWLENGKMSRPEPFRTMPITYERAFGGTVDVLLDEGSPLPLSWPYNPKGRGFHPGGELTNIKNTIYCAPGYPRLPSDFRHLLPNIELPHAPITSPEDRPLPAGFGAVPPGSPLYMIPWLQRKNNASNGKDPMEQIDDLLAEGAQMTIPRETLFRCHPDWRIAPPEPNAIVKMMNLTPEGHIAFPLPRLTVSIDFCIGKKTGARPLVPFMLVFLPEEKQFYIVYRDTFMFEASARDERSLRLNVAL